MTVKKDPNNRVRRRCFLIAAAGVALIILAGCGSGETDRELAPSASTAPTPPAWETKFTPEQLKIYREAEVFLAGYEPKDEAVFRTGKATRAAKELFQDNRADWQGRFAELQQYERQDIQFGNRPEVLSAEPTYLKADGAEAGVVIERCIDSSKVNATADGAPLAVYIDYPVTQTVEVARYKDGKWRIVQVKTSEDECAV